MTRSPARGPFDPGPGARLVPMAAIDAAAFAPFGDLLDAPSPAPRQDRAVALENCRETVPVNLALIRSDPYPGLMPLVRLERHPLSSQTFLPLRVGSYVVVVAPDRDGRPDEDGLRAFLVPGHVGLHYRAGAWHAHMMTLAEAGTFAMLVHEDGSDADCEFAAIAPVRLRESG